MKMIAVWYLCCSSRSSARICACVVTSIAVVGSSAISRRGLHDSAIAIIARCRRPPDNCHEYASIRCSGIEMPTSRNNSTVIARACVAADDGRPGVVQHDRLDDLRAHRVHRAECRHRLLRDQRDLGAAQGAHQAAARRQAGQVDRSWLPWRYRISPPVMRPGRIDQLQDRAHRYALAAAAFADDADDLAGEYVEAHAIDRAHRAFVHAERHAQVAHPQQRFSGCRDRRHRAGRRPPG